MAPTGASSLKQGVVKTRGSCSFLSPLRQDAELQCQVSPLLSKACICGFKAHLHPCPLALIQWSFCSNPTSPVLLSPSSATSTSVFHLESSLWIFLYPRCLVSSQGPLFSALYYSGWVAKGTRGGWGGCRNVAKVIINPLVTEISAKHQAF